MIHLAGPSPLSIETLTGCTCLNAGSIRKLAYRKRIAEIALNLDEPETLEALQAAFYKYAWYTISKRTAMEKGKQESLIFVCDHPIPLEGVCTARILYDALATILTVCRGAADILNLENATIRESFVSRVPLGNLSQPFTRTRLPIQEQPNTPRLETSRTVIMSAVQSPEDIPIGGIYELDTGSAEFTIPAPPPELPQEVHRRNPYNDATPSERQLNYTLSRISFNHPIGTPDTPLRTIAPNLATIPSTRQNTEGTYIVSYAMHDGFNIHMNMDTFELSSVARHYFNGAPLTTLWSYSNNCQCDRCAITRERRFVLDNDYGDLCPECTFLENECVCEQDENEDDNRDNEPLDFE